MTSSGTVKHSDNIFGVVSRLYFLSQWKPFGFIWSALFTAIISSSTIPYITCTDEAYASFPHTHVTDVDRQVNIQIMSLVSNTRKRMSLQRDRNYLFYVFKVKLINLTSSYHTEKYNLTVFHIKLIRQSDCISCWTDEDWLYVTL